MSSVAVDSAHPQSRAGDCSSPDPPERPAPGLLLFGGAIHRPALPASSAPPARLSPWGLRDPAPQEEEEEENWRRRTVPAAQASGRRPCAVRGPRSRAGSWTDKWRGGSRRWVLRGELVSVRSGELVFEVPHYIPVGICFLLIVRSTGNFN